MLVAAQTRVQAAHVASHTHCVTSSVQAIWGIPPAKRSDRPPSYMPVGCL